MQKAKVVLAIVTSLALLPFVASWPIDMQNKWNRRVIKYMKELADFADAVGTGRPEKPWRYISSNFESKCDFHFLLTWLKVSLAMFQKLSAPNNPPFFVRDSAIALMESCSRVVPSMNKRWDSLDPKDMTYPDFLLWKQYFLEDCVPPFLQLQENDSCSC